MTPGNALVRNRNGESTRPQDFNTVSGTDGEFQGWLHPTETRPPLALDVPKPVAAFRSTSSTSWPSRARKYAVVTPTTPPPSTMILFADGFEAMSLTRCCGRGGTATIPPFPGRLRYRR